MRARLGINELRIDAHPVLVARTEPSST
jgi:hypothetical protein